MKVGVISDTHDRLESIKKVKEIFKKHKVGMIVHCGDWVSPFTLEYFDYIFKGFRIPVKSVFGNNEGDIKRIIERNAELTNPIQFAPKDVFELEIGKRKVAVYHGHDKVVLGGLIKSGSYDVVFTGHTHKVKDEVVGKTYVLNPGCVNYASESRIIKEASVAIYSPKSNMAEIVNL